MAQRYLTAIFDPVQDQAKKCRLLLVEDEEGLRQTLRLNLELEGYHVTTATTGPEALEKLRGAHFDGAVMDVMLPGLDGFTVCETARLEGDRTPVLFLTARTAPADRLRSLRLGDDHLGKPFELEELLLRVSKVVRNKVGRAGEGAAERYVFGPSTIDFISFEGAGPGGTRKLSQREVMLLRLLTDRAGEVVSREEILQKVWGYDVFPTTRTIDNFIVVFRKLFEPDPRAPRHFLSIRGVGYRFDP
ncbi:MAG: response regulator transcription factor [Flavobacteriales bacterium]|jgi:two-component system alkaline phosphatase synthesis response regulator PhoP|nr:response regulator transcription factor [Flavobacteriales bacterium]MBK6753346.1 response regulator transcription factor [Flavobacteriales bacterium]MBK7269208.1 response regulator transcription factor [Flavobacteriales bacterium]MBK7753990.1 response regulator transcription factor [Flavobacteriales bacterium]MBK9077252.1 response regulator transcription factor [Flavobacteriales bacterium]